MTDESTGGEPGQPEQPVFDMTPAVTTLPAEPPRRSRRTLAVAAAAAIGLVVAGGTFTAVQLLNGSTADPASAAPASTFAFVQVDLDPSAAQKLGIYRFSKRFPKSPTATKGDSASVVDTLLTEILDSSDSPISYQADVKPWLGGSAAFAAYEGTDGKAKPVAILGYKDKDKADAALKKASADGKGGYVFLKDFVVLAQTTADAKAAADAATTKSLAESSSSYSADVDKLSGSPVITAWADLSKAFPVLYKQFGGLLQGFGGFASLAGQTTARMPSPACIAELNALHPSGSGDPYAGLSATCRAELFGSAPSLTTKQPAPLPTLDPSMTPKGRFAMGVTVDNDVAQLEARGFGNTSATTQLKGSKDAARYIDQMPNTTSVGVALGDIRPGVKAFFDNLSKSPFGAQFSDSIDQAERESGLSFPADITAVLGDAIAVAYDKKSDDFAVRTHPENADRAKSILDKLQQSAGDSEPVDITTNGRDVVVSSSADYTKAITGSGGLAATDLFHKAIGDLPSAPQLVAFGNLEQLLQGVDDDTVDHFRAFGVLVGGDSANPSVVIRLVVR